MAFEQLVLLVKQNPSGRELARRDIKSLLSLLDRCRHSIRRLTVTTIHPGNLV